MCVILLLLILFICTSCNESCVNRLEYISHTLELDSISVHPISHKHWRKIELRDICHNSIDSIRPKTAVLISSDYELDSLVFPPDVELCFCGGSLKGDITFNGTLLSGKVRLHGSTIHGTIENDVFEAGWLCVGNGIQDDANNINQILRVANTIHFNKGTYLLASNHSPQTTLAEKYHKAVDSHIGIYRDGISLLGEDGASFMIKDSTVAISIYSKPNDIKNSVKNVRIDGLTFRVENNGRNFFEYIHTIKLLGVNKCVISNCKFFDFWGDAISLSHYGDIPETGERTRNSHIRISNNYIDGGNHNNRNGISIINGYDVTIENNMLIETSKHNMPGSIDVEANNTAYTIDRILIKNNIISGCDGGLGSIGIVSNKNEAPANNIIIQGNLILHSSKGICLLIDSQNASGNIKIIDNQFVDCTNPLIIRGNGKCRNVVIKQADYESINIKGSVDVNSLN